MQHSLGAVKPHAAPRFPVLRPGTVVIDVMGDVDERCGDDVAAALIDAAGRGHATFSINLRHVERLPQQKQPALSAAINRVRLQGCAVTVAAKRPLRGALGRLNVAADEARVAADTCVARHVVIARHAKRPK